MLILIARAVRLTLLNSEIQSLKPGEIYEVSPAIGNVLVADGWASEVTADAGGPSDAPDPAADKPSGEISGS